MSETNDGGQAFPTGRIHDSYGLIEREFEIGITIRDYFAAASLPFIAERMKQTDMNFAYDVIAECAYEIADAMLAKRAAAPAGSGPREEG